MNVALGKGENMRHDGKWREKSGESGQNREFSGTERDSTLEEEMWETSLK